MKVLVTGGTSGLGLAMASALATAGAAVALTGRSGQRASSVAADLPDAVGIEHDERIVAVEFERWLRDRNARR
jgi:gluconate 5-dehydrogenase